MYDPAAAIMLRAFFVLRPKMSLELRVKEKLLRYPEEVFFDSQGISVKLLSSCLIMLVLV